MKKFLVIVVAIGASLVAYWLIAPLFVDEAVNDELPIAFTEADLMELSASMPDLMMDDAMPREARIISHPTSQDQTGASAAPTRPAAFPIVDTPGHPATGEVKVLESGDQTFVRFENYDGTNGPDLFVYLAKDLDATEFVNLGRAKGNMGNINYEVPEDVDVSEYKYVMTWCRLFGVLFDYAEIAA